jgi:GTP-binding protein HflX
LEEVREADLIVHVVDASDADPEAQIRAVHEVFGEIDATGVPEQIVFNKVDAADSDVLLRLKRLVPTAIFVSARTGQGIAELRESIERELPRPAVEVDVLLPYSRGDLLARVHDRAEVLSTEHTADGTRLRARVAPDLAAALDPYAS